MYSVTILNLGMYEIGKKHDIQYQEDVYRNISLINHDDVNPIPCIRQY